MQLIDDLIQWLPEVGAAQIEAYGRGLPSDFWNNGQEFAEVLMDMIRTKRGNEVRSFLGGNCCLVLSEPQQMELIESLALYNTPSVIRNFSKRFPELQTTPPAAPLTDWARAMMALWRNGLLLTTFPLYTEYSLYLKSLVGLKLSTDQVAALAAQCLELYAEVLNGIRAQNFEARPLEPALQEKAYLFLKSLQFLAEDMCRRLAYGSSAELEPMLDILHYDIDILNMVASTGKDYSNPQKMAYILWNELAADDQFDLLRESDRQFAEARLKKELDQGTKTLLTMFEQLFTVPRIESGYTQQYLSQYMAQLSPQQKESFLRLFKSFLHSSPLVDAICETVDLDFFLSTLENKQYEGNKNDFVNSLENRVPPSIWREAQQIFLTIAAVI